MRKWLQEAKNLCCAEHAREFRLDNLDKEIAFLEKSISEGNPRKIGFCHNDLQYGNIMIDDVTRSINIIALSHSIGHKSKYHALDIQKVIVYIYSTVECFRREKYACIDISICCLHPDHEANNTEIEQLVDDVEKYTLANHIFWGLWGIISGYVNHIEFDYMEYGRQRFEQYWSRKHGIFNEK